MFTINANASGSRHIEVSDTHLQTIEHYALLKDLIDSNGIIDEGILEKLRLNCRSILESQTTVDKSLIDLCLDVIYNTNMKAIGLQNLLALFIDWTNRQSEEGCNETESK